jgi:dTDP-4-dehydrorhamnose 3,5-epimerase
VPLPVATRRVRLQPSTDAAAQDAAIAGLRVRPLRRIPDDRGCVLHMLRADDGHFERFGEIYFSLVYPGVVKGWHRHRAMDLNYAVPVGMVRLVVVDARPASPTLGTIAEIYTGHLDYALVHVPSGTWNGFMGLGTEPALVANCATLPHDPGEIEALDPDAGHFGYRWPVKNR